MSATMSVTVTTSCSLSILAPPPRATLFPYTTLFRSLKTVSDHRLASGFDHPRTNKEVLAAKLGDRKSTRLNSSHITISYAVFCLKKKTAPRPQRDVRCPPARGQPDLHHFRRLPPPRP